MEWFAKAGPSQIEDSTGHKTTEIMSFDGTEGSDVSLEDAAAMTEDYRDASLNSQKGTFIGRDLIDDILAQSGCKGLRIYFALNSMNALTVVVVGADSSEDDQIGGSDTIAEMGVGCPSNCGSGNDLNS